MLQEGTNSVSESVAGSFQGVLCPLLYADVSDDLEFSLCWMIQRSAPIQIRQSFQGDGQSQRMLLVERRDSRMLSVWCRFARADVPATARVGTHEAESCLHQYETTAPHVRHLRSGIVPRARWGICRLKAGACVYWFHHDSALQMPSLSVDAEGVGIFCWFRKARLRKPSRWAQGTHRCSSPSCTLSI